MRILMVSEDLPSPTLGGLARHVLSLSRALTAAGHHVDLMGNSDVAPAVNAEALQGIGQFFPALRGQFDGWKEMPLGVFMPMKRSLIARRFARAIMARAADYDAIHYHGHLPNLAHYLPASVNFLQTRHDQGSDCLTHIRFARGAVCTERDPEACAGCRSWQPNWLQRKISAWAVRQFRREVQSGFRRHKTVFVSDLLRRNLERSFGEGRWGITVHNFVDTALLHAARVQSGTTATNLPLRVFIAAKLYPAKGVHTFLETLAPRLHAGLRIDIAGDGPEEAPLRARFPQVQFHGWQSGHDTARLAARAHLIVVPSVCEEACPSTVLEALLLGKTVLALRRGGTPELGIYASGPEQLRLYADMQALVAALLAFDPRPDYAVAPRVPADASHAAGRLLALYSLPPGPIGV